MPVEVYKPENYILLANMNKVPVHKLEFNARHQRLVEVSAYGYFQGVPEEFLSKRVDTAMYERSLNKAYDEKQRREVIEKLLRAWELQPLQNFTQLLVNGVLSGQRTINIVDFAHLEDFDVASRVLAYAQHFQNPRLATSFVGTDPGLTPTANTLKRARKEDVVEKEESLEDILRDFQF